jgi:16S rRNA (cytidine1402-2'-O)-methyltransferase
MNGTLFVVATPIGNLKDITLRAIEVLQSVDCVVCEDTRTSGVLLKHYNISKRLLSFNAQATDKKLSQIIELLREGKNCALITDAGTPAISDPGVLLVRAVYDAFGVGAHVVTIPGASAVISAASISGFPVSDFLFLGFLPHKKGRQTLLKEIALSERTVILYESSHRILKLVEELKSHIDDVRLVGIGRELTKKFETFVRGNLSEVTSYLNSEPNHQKGEFVVLIAGK